MRMVVNGKISVFLLQAGSLWNKKKSQVLTWFVCIYKKDNFVYVHGRFPQVFYC